MRVENRAMKEELEKQKEELIEQLGVQFENDNLAPLAARVMATLILNGKQGITFDKLVCSLNASKSTISTHLEHLQATNKVKYFTKTGDRKRYFIINPDLMLNVIDEMIAKWEAETLIHEKILAYKKKYNEVCIQDQEFKFDLEFQKDVLAFLSEATTAIQKLKTKINQRNS